MPLSSRIVHENSSRADGQSLKSRQKLEAMVTGFKLLFCLREEVRPRAMQRAVLPRVAPSWCLRGRRCTFAVEDLDEGGRFDVLFWFLGAIYTKRVFCYSIVGRVSEISASSSL